MNIFVYDQHRVDDEFYEHIKCAVQNFITDCVVEGDLYYHPTNTNAPVARFSKQSEGVVWGDLLEVALDSREVTVMRHRNRAAGLLEREVKVLCKGGKEVKAYAYQWPEEVEAGECIITGEWRKRHITSIRIGPLLGMYGGRRMERKGSGDGRERYHKAFRWGGSAKAK